MCFSDHLRPKYLPQFLWGKVDFFSFLAQDTYLLNTHYMEKTTDLGMWGEMVIKYSIERGLWIC